MVLNCGDSRKRRFNLIIGSLIFSILSDGLICIWVNSTTIISWRLKYNPAFSLSGLLKASVMRCGEGMAQKSLGSTSVSGSSLHFRCYGGILGPHNKLQKLGGLKQQKLFFFFFAILEGKSPENQGIVGRAPCEGFGEDPSFLLSG